MKNNGNRILVTGGAGFIGSHIVDALIQRDDVTEVRVLDNLFSGSKANLAHLEGNAKFVFIEGDIRNLEVCKEAVKGVDLICHQAALGSVPRSVADPVTTNEVNVSGTLNIFEAARLNGVTRVVYASSSSVYGDNEELPKKEENIGKPLSPYALTKAIAEQYAQVYHRVYGIDFIGLRYFNVFGPRQSPTGQYAAVIPLLVEAGLNSKAPVFFGDGSQSRDFTYVANAVQANILALYTNNAEALNRVYNVAIGKSISLLDLNKLIQQVTGVMVAPSIMPERVGDIKHSLASISNIVTMLDYKPQSDFVASLQKTVESYISKNI